MHPPHSSGRAGSADARPAASSSVAAAYCVVVPMLRRRAFLSSAAFVADVVASRAAIDARAPRHRQPRFDRTPRPASPPRHRPSVRAPLQWRGAAASTSVSPPRRRRRHRWRPLAAKTSSPLGLPTKAGGGDWRRKEQQRDFGASPSLARARLTVRARRCRRVDDRVLWLPPTSVRLHRTSGRRAGVAAARSGTRFDRGERRGGARTSSSRRRGSRFYMGAGAAAGAARASRAAPPPPPRRRRRRTSSPQRIAPEQVARRRAAIDDLPRHRRRPRDPDRAAISDPTLLRLARGVLRILALVDALSLKRVATVLSRRRTSP